MVSYLVQPLYSVSDRIRGRHGLQARPAKLNRFVSTSVASHALQVRVPAVIWGQS